jgi:hypothetical protein
MTTRSPGWSRTSGTGAIASLGLLATACFAENVKTKFPAGLDPLDAANPAAFPAPVGTDLYPETPGPGAMTVVTQEVGELDPGCSCRLVLAYAKGYVKRPLADVWAAGVDPQTSAEAASSVDTCSVTLDVEKGYDYSWLVHYGKTQIISIWFDVTWRSGTLPWPTPPGGPPSPLQVAWRFQKTNGTQYVKAMAGSVLAYEIVPGVTGLEFIRHVQAARSPPDVVAGGIQNHYDNILAKLAAVPPTPPAYTNRICTGP